MRQLLTVACGLIVFLIHTGTLYAQKEFGFDNRKASGQPYLSPEESVKRMKTPPGWEVKLFAAEPDVVNPIAFTIDERGRVWVVECFEYPSRTPKGRMPRDRIKVLEDTDGDGQCDKATIWAEGKDFPVRFDLASGIEVGHGGVFLGAPPYLWFLQDTNNDGKCDKFEILLKGFGSQDTHETLNTFQWGPDGRLYGLHGIFTHSEIVSASSAPPREKEDSRGGAESAEKKDAVKIDAAVWRYDVRTKKFEIFAEGTSNPWGMDFDANGNCFVCCCVIPHLFHIIPGGTYVRQDGKLHGSNPYSFGQLKEICDHTHHKESGWAHAGLLVMQGRHVPDEYQNSVLMGSIHGCSIKRDVLRRNGSSFIASHAPDFLVSGDKNFRPINLRWGPNGDIYVIDWHDQNPCHQTKAEDWDYARGRVYRIQRKGAKPAVAEDFSKKSEKELLDLLYSTCPWRSRTALRIISERGWPRSREVSRSLIWDAVFGNLKAFWAMISAGALQGLTGDGWLHSSKKDDVKDRIPASLRSWVIRRIGENAELPREAMAELVKSSSMENSAEVRLQLVSTMQRLSKYDTMPVLHNLMLHKEDAADPAIPLMLWLAYEPQVVAEQKRVLNWQKKNAAGNPLVTNEIVPRTMRRLALTGHANHLAACVQFVDEVQDAGVRRQALQGLVEAVRSRPMTPPAEWDRVYAQLLKQEDPGVQRQARRLAIHFRGKKELERALAIARDVKQPKADRLEAINDLGLTHPADALQPLLDIFRQSRDEELRLAAVAALGNYDSRDIPPGLLAAWKDCPPRVRVECVTVLRSRKEWARELLAAVGTGQVPRTDLTDSTILFLRNFHDRELNEQIEKAWGQVRDTPQELEKVIAEMRNFVQEKEGDAAKGLKVFEKTCMQCHRFDGKGHNVGPNLDGAERSLEYLLTNILDPNRVIGQPYYQRVVLLKSGKLVIGLLAAEDPQSITLKRENDALEAIQRTDIDEMKTEPKSLMPEGLGNNMTKEEFRDLVTYLRASAPLREKKE